MNLNQRKNFQRLLAPKHLAVIGGRDAEIVIRENQRRGFMGDIWAVNPKREQIAGYPCFRKIADLPEPPDAVFLAVPKEHVIDVLEQLRDGGAGGVVCYSAGFGELGTEGKKREAELIKAAGDMALIGPNCYGMINYLNKVALWPFSHGGFCPGYGAAIITQSGMMSSDMTMNQRHIPLTHMISAGNQAVLQLEDFVDILCQKPEVRAIGLHIEGLRDIEAFAKAAYRALEYETPLVVFKTGISKIGANLTISHTGSLSGADELYQTLFDRLGIIRVDNLVQMLETLKFISVAGIPKGKNLIGFTCSGGGATMIADGAEKLDIALPPIRTESHPELTTLLPDIATISNPLDYTTPIWGMAEKTEPVFRTAIGEGQNCCYDGAMIIEDFPHPDFPESRIYYDNDARAFIAASQACALPAMLCATLPENLDEEARTLLVSNHVAPMQGLPEALRAFADAADYEIRRTEILKKEKWQPRFAKTQKQERKLYDEWQAKQLLQKADITTACGVKISSDANQEEIAQAAETLKFPWVVKVISSAIAHKTEMGAVMLNLNNAQEAKAACQRIKDNLRIHAPDAEIAGFLLEQMAPSPLAELLVNIRNDAEFGMVMVLGSGGIFVEILKDAHTLLLPCQEKNLQQALDGLKIAPLLQGFRGRDKANQEALIAQLMKLIDFAQNHQENIAEIEINPLFVSKDGACVVDALIQYYC